MDKWKKNVTNILDLRALHSLLSLLREHDLKQLELDKSLGLLFYAISRGRALGLELRVNLEDVGLEGGNKR